MATIRSDPIASTAKEASIANHANTAATMDAAGGVDRAPDAAYETDGWS